MDIQSQPVKPFELIQPRTASYLKSTFYARWVIILIVVAGYFVIPALHHPIVLALLPIAALYNLLLLGAARWHWRHIANQWLMITIDSLMALVLIVYTGGITSPYLLLLGFMIVSSGYWYGVVSAVMVGAAQTGLLIFYQLWQNHEPDTSTLKRFAIEMLVMVTVGMYVAWLTSSGRSERDKLVALGTEIEKERQQLLALINNMRDAVIVVDNDQRIAIYNHAAADLTDPGKNLHHMPVNDGIQFLDDNGHLVELKLGGDTPQERKDLRAKAADGSLINVSISTAPYIVDRQNRGHIIIIRDISQEKTIEREREEFIAVASHELRTPLTIAQGSISLLLSPSYLPDKPEVVNMLNSSLRSLQQLSRIISDLTNLSQVANAQLSVQLEPLNPVALLHEFEADYGDQAKAKGLEFKVEIDRDLSSATILTSRYVVREILSIYVSNAIKFTDHGTITLRAMNPTDRHDGVTFVISDTGEGISQSDQKKIFEKFFQSEDYETRVHGGTGLGLYIARSLADRITARVWFKTELGKGSTFYLWVPPYSHHKLDRGKIAAAETKDFLSNV